MLTLVLNFASTNGSIDYLTEIGNSFIITELGISDNAVIYVFVILIERLYQILL